MVQDHLVWIVGVAWPLVRKTIQKKHRKETNPLLKLSLVSSCQGVCAWVAYLARFRKVREDERAHCRPCSSKSDFMVLSYDEQITLRTY